MAKKKRIQPAVGWGVTVDCGPLGFHLIDAYEPHPHRERVAEWDGLNGYAPIRVAIIPLDVAVKAGVVTQEEAASK